MRILMMTLCMLAESGHATMAHAQSAGARRVAACEGPAMSLPDSLARRLPPRTGRMIPDDKWADLARTVPGGFAGTLRDSAQHVVIRLTHPELAAEAKAALRTQLPIGVDWAIVQPARWDFGQLVDWFNYLLPRLHVAVMADKDESLNRVRFSVTSVEAREQVLRALAPLGLPCDLVVVDLNGGVVRF
ncbi:MAG TPA: hypothetical protein VK636_08380 [Gemmatimonadaceae bacterium]|nr:hypothetical protein [Gemmatimonadaceae bacterium]